MTTTIDPLAAPHSYRQSFTPSDAVLPPRDLLELSTGHRCATFQLVRNTGGTYFCQHDQICLWQDVETARRRAAINIASSVSIVVTSIVATARVGELR